MLCCGTLLPRELLLVLPRVLPSLLLCVLPPLLVVLLVVVLLPLWWCPALAVALAKTSPHYR